MTGPAIALFHGGGQGSWVWSETVAALRDRGAATIALDVPGCGTKRGRDVAALTVDDIVRELVADLRVAGVGPVVLVGHSLAGTLLPRIVEAVPDLIARLVYLTCSAPLPGVSPFAQIGRGMHGDHPDEVGRPLDPATAAPADQYRAMFCNDMDEAATAASLAGMERDGGRDGWPMDATTRTDWRYDHIPAIPATYILCKLDRAAVGVAGSLRRAAACAAGRAARCRASGDEHPARDAGQYAAGGSGGLNRAAA